MQQYSNEFIGAAISVSASVSVCFIADILVIRISVNLLIGASLNSNIRTTYYKCFCVSTVEYIAVVYRLPSQPSNPYTTDKSVTDLYLELPQSCYISFCMSVTDELSLCCLLYLTDAVHSVDSSIHTYL